MHCWTTMMLNNDDVERRQWRWQRRTTTTPSSPSPKDAVHFFSRRMTARSWQQDSTMSNKNNDIKQRRLWMPSIPRPNKRWRDERWRQRDTGGGVTIKITTICIMAAKTLSSPSPDERRQDDNDKTRGWVTIKYHNQHNDDNNVARRRHGTTICAWRHNRTAQHQDGTAQQC